jgi:Carboxypeptidase regulatory-like domain
LEHKIRARSKSAQSFKLEVDVNRIGFCLLVGFLAFAVASGTVWAQGTTAQISGTAKDPSGAVLPGVEITATQTATGRKRATVTNETGNYVLPSLPIGPYVVEASLPGFKTYVQTGIVLQVDDSPVINVVLQVGQVSEQVEVEANAALVETQRTAIGQVVTNQQIAELPLNGRDAHELIFLAGMATPPGVGSMNSIRNYPTVVVSVAGGNGDGVSYLLDGSIWQDPYNSLSMPLPFPDALQEFKVETSAMQAQHGFHATATVNAVTRSGTNDFHGTVFEFLRNYKFNARDAFAKQRDTYKRNQFGGVIGGPIKKDKLFFFGGYQRTSLRSDGVQNTAFIPTPAALEGDFTDLASAACNNGVAKTLPANLGFSNNKIDKSLLDPVAVNLAKTLPVTTDPCGRTLYGMVANQDEDLATAKLDYTLSAKSSLFGRFMMGRLNTGSTYDGKNPLSINTYGYQDFHYGVNIGHTYLISTNIVNSLRIGANRTNVVKFNDDFKSWADLGANVTPLAGNMISLTATGAFLIGGGAASPGEQHNGPMPSVVDDVNWIKGTHQIGFGGATYQQRLNYWSGVNGVGAATFNGQVTGLLLGDVMLGRPSTFNQGTVYGFYTRQFYHTLYLQDSWKATPRLTLNYGIRWEPYLSPYNNRGENEHFDLEGFKQGVHSKVFVNAPAGLFFPGDPQYTSGKYFNGPRWAKFFPRFGLAWDPEGKGRMTVRAAYGMYGDRAMMLAGTQMYFSAPFGSLLSNSGVTLTNPWSSTQGGNPMPTLASLQGIGVYDKNIPFFQNGNYVTVKMNDFDPVYMNQWNLNIQRQFGQNWLVTANYVGNNTIHMITTENINPAQYFYNGTTSCTMPNGLTPTPPATTGTQCSTTTNQQSRRILNFMNQPDSKYYASVGYLDDGATANYEALNLSVQKRLSKGVSGQANYTWSHCISDVYADNPTAGGVSIAGNRGQYRGNCLGIDRRHLFGMSMVATTPKFSNKTLRILASDWQFAPLLTMTSAQLFSVFLGTDDALTTVGNQTPVLVDPKNVYPKKKTADKWINASAFARPDPGTYGNVGYNSFAGPRTFQLNAALSRVFPIHESTSIQVRAEAFNLPNHVNLATPGAGGPGGIGRAVNLNSPNFGQITSDISGNSGLQAGDYRIIQFAMKLMF